MRKTIQGMRRERRTSEVVKASPAAGGCSILTASEGEGEAPKSLLTGEVEYCDMSTWKSALSIINEPGKASVSKQSPSGPSLLFPQALPKLNSPREIPSLPPLAILALLPRPRPSIAQRAKVPVSSDRPYRNHTRNE
jgi:hypothetical protein